MRQHRAKKSGKTFTVRFWGVRGSYPTTDQATRDFGGNTSCVEIIAAGQRCIFDAGTGIIPLGKEICRNHSAEPTACVFLSHTHIDHVMGLCFFEPLLTANARSYIYGPGNSHGALARSLQQLTHSDLFPVSFDEVKGKKEIHSLTGGELIRLRAPGKRPLLDKKPVPGAHDADALTVTTLKSPAHPRFGVMLYRVSYKGKSIVYATDIEQQDGGYPEVIEFAGGADLLIHDAQYLHGEYFSPAKPKKGWGHSTIEMAAEVARKAKVNRLALFHHEPAHDDRAMRAIERRAKRLFPHTITARQGSVIEL
ncbi:MAG: MBL fold metallo-hydrolase [Deltaproteobacteria bacterium]|nr:MBL fold metallo-hydrolase [Deltaproteobacteria bacterium]